MGGDLVRLNRVQGQLQSVPALWSVGLRIGMWADGAVKPKRSFRVGRAGWTTAAGETEVLLLVKTSPLIASGHELEEKHGANPGDGEMADFAHPGPRMGQTFSRCWSFPHV